MDGVVEVRSGRLQGVRRNGIWSFSGIPYAASPAGPRRWRPPQPPEPWAGVRPCDRFGPTAPQAPGVLETSLRGDPTEHSEDCLSLNLWTPATGSGRRPVMVWIHGGSFLSGSGSLGLYRGGLLAREGDVVVVTLNYRLGLLGFLAHPALEEPGQTWLDGREWTGFGNWGLADQIAALQWVHEHADLFGGDPDNVTVFGESAGGMSISALLATPAARGLFHRAIVQSGPPYTMPAEQAGVRAEELAHHLGADVSRHTLERLPAKALVAAAADVGGQLAQRGESGLLMMPVVDGGLLARAPEDEVAAGSARDVSLLIGTNRDETSFFTLGSTRFASLDESGLRDWVTLLFPDPAAVESVIARVGQARAARGEAVTPRHLWTAISTEHLFRWPSVRLADAHASAVAAETGGVPGRRPGARVSTYCYLFTWESPAFGGVLGSSHALEIPFVFGTVHLPGVQPFSGGGEEAFALSAAMRQAWVSFARSGSPDQTGGGGLDGPGPLGSARSIISDGSIASDGSRGATHEMRAQPSDRADPRPTDETAEWPPWDPRRRPTMVFGPWPGSHSVRRPVDAPRNAELEVVAAAGDPPPTWVAARPSPAPSPSSVGDR